MILIVWVRTLREMKRRSLLEDVSPAVVLIVIFNGCEYLSGFNPDGIM